MEHSKKIAGYILGAISAASYGLNPTFTLPLYSAGMNPDSVLLLRYGLAIIMLAVMMYIKGYSFIIPRKSIAPLICMGILMALSSLTLYDSYNYMAAGIASTILFVYPIMVAVIMTVFFHERISPATIICILIATCGIALLYNSDDGTTLSLTGTLLVIASALSYAIYLVGVGSKSFSSVPSLTLTFYVLLFGSLLFSCRMLAPSITFTPPDSWSLWLDVMALAMLPTMISFICTAKAIQLIGSTPTAILGALEPVTAVIMGVLLFNEHVSGREFVGIIMILAAVSIVVALGAKKNTGQQ